MDYDETELLRTQKFKNDSLQPFLFPNLKRKYTSKKLAKISQGHYERIWGIFAQHFNRLRIIYKTLFNEIKKKDLYYKELEDIKIKFKQIELEDDLFSKYNSNSNSMESRSDNESSSSDSESSSSNSSSEDSTATSPKYHQERGTYHMEENYFQEDFDEWINDDYRTTLKEGLQHMELK